ncbi:hypothetical protein JZO77_16660 [Enterococcus hulanensis]|uniref:hypothetical protein n=1 Tax=Enterococcus hulanensis TaxID=2559929 RepID=UPI001A8F681B|nr:hypothetical protein [Enterococcus hulanensis]MBO0458366.1 hypothetical protein [Enterococcus hulanensis]
MEIKVNKAIDLPEFTPSKGDIIVHDDRLFVLGASHFHVSKNVQYGYVLLNGVSTSGGWRNSIQEAFDNLPSEMKQFGITYFPRDHVAITVDWVE